MSSLDIIQEMIEDAFQNGDRANVLLKEGHVTKNQLNEAYNMFWQLIKEKEGIKKWIKR